MMPLSALNYTVRKLKSWQVIILGMKRIPQSGKGSIIFLLRREKDPPGDGIPDRLELGCEWPLDD